METTECDRSTILNTSHRLLSSTICGQITGLKHGFTGMECNATIPGKGTSLSSVQGTPPLMAHFTTEMRCMSLKDGRRLFRRRGLKKFPGICSAWMDTLMMCPIRKGGRSEEHTSE